MIRSGGARRKLPSGEGGLVWVQVQAQVQRRTTLEPEPEHELELSPTLAPPGGQRFRVKAALSRRLENCTDRPGGPGSLAIPTLSTDTGVNAYVQGDRKAVAAEACATGRASRSLRESNSYRRGLPTAMRTSDFANRKSGRMGAQISSRFRSSAERHLPVKYQDNTGVDADGTDRRRIQAAYTRGRCCLRSQRLRDLGGTGVTLMDAAKKSTTGRALLP